LIAVISSWHHFYLLLRNSTSIHYSQHWLFLRPLYNILATQILLGQHHNCDTFWILVKKQ
jgi:hypothetical protein